MEVALYNENKLDQKIFFICMRYQQTNNQDYCE